MNDGETMRMLIALILGLLLCQATYAAPRPAKLQHTLDFIFQKVLELKHKEFNQSIALPKYFFQSRTPLKQFQDAIEKQWGFRPDVFTNAFALENNEIYIMDEAKYYQEQKRCMDDSVAHELVHYIQTKYMGWDLNDESLEWDAIDIQTQFREAYCKID